MSDNPLQRTAQWFSERVGCLTASIAKDCIRLPKTGKRSQTYRNLIDRLVTERLTGQPVSSAVGAAALWGEEHEDEARSAYEAATGEFVDLVGFVPHPDVKWLGASPDGLVGEDGLVEIKCPTTMTHVSRMTAGVVPEDVKPQMLVQLLCTGRKWVDFVDYDPRIKLEAGRLFIRRFEPSQEELDEALAACVDCLNDVQEAVESFVTIAKNSETAA